MATNTNTENIIVNVESKYKDKGLAELKKILSGTNLAMNNMEKAGKQNSDSFIKLQARTIALNSKINELKKSYTDVGKATKTVHADTGKLSGGVKNLVSSLPLLSLGLAGVAAGIIKFGVDSFKMGADFQELRSNFIGSAKDLELFRKATAGTVSDGGLITLSNYASDLGVSLKDQALLFSLAEDASDKYGGTVQDNFERVINATDGSARGLRAIGIGVKEYNQELEKLLPNNVKNIDDLDAETQQQIRLEAIIKAKGITIDDVNKKQQSNADVIANLGILYDTFATNVGLAVNESTDLSKAMPGLTSMTADLGKAFGTLISDVAKAAENLKSFLKDALYSYLEFTNNLTEQDKDVRDQARIDNRISFLEQQDAEKKKQQEALMVNQPSKEEFIKNKTYSPTTKTSSRGGGTTKDKGLTESEKEKLARQEAILTINSRGEAEFLELTKLKFPQKTDWMAGLSEKEIKSFMDFETTPGNTPPEEQSSTLLADSETIYQNISSLMGVLEVGTQTFVGQLLKGFGMAFQIMDVASSLLKFIPVFGSFFGGRASGGMVNAGGTYLVGEQGPEILQMSGSGGMVYNNSQTNKLMNQSLNKSNPINVYVSSNIDQRYLKVGIEKYNANQKYIRV